MSCVVFIRPRCTAVAIVFVAAHLVGMLHGLVRHEVCPSHGDVIDVRANEMAPTAPGSPQDVLVADEREETAEHRHCTDVLDRRAVVVASATDSLVQPLPPAALRFSGADDLLPPAVAQFRLAPKQSPPRS